MDSAVKEKWLAALRSGNYRQGKHSLRRTPPYGVEDTQPSFCCLGVLCEVAVAEGVIEPATGDVYYVDGLANSSYLPYRVADWAGIDWQGNLPDGRGLTSLNDRPVTDGIGFAEIADVIEAVL